MDHESAIKYHYYYYYYYETCLVDPDISTTQSAGRVLSWFQCWQAVSSFLHCTVMCEVQAKPFNPPATEIRKNGTAEKREKFPIKNSNLRCFAAELWETDLRPKLIV